MQTMAIYLPESETVTVANVERIKHFRAVSWLDAIDIADRNGCHTIQTVERGRAGLVRDLDRKRLRGQDRIKSAAEFPRTEVYRRPLSSQAAKLRAVRSA